MNNQINITFKIHYQTLYSYALYISGSAKELGCWDPHQAIRLNWTQGNWWTTTIMNIPEGQFDYKFFIAKFDNPTSEIRWEQGPNRSVNSKGYTKKNLEICDIWEFKKVILRLFESTHIIQCEQQNCSAFKCGQLQKSNSIPSTPNKGSLSFTYRKESTESSSSYNSRQNSSSISSNSTSTTEDPITPGTPENCDCIGIKQRYFVTANIESMGNLMKLQKMKKYNYRIRMNATTNCSEQKEIIYWEKQFLVKSSQQSLKYKYAYKSQAQDNDQMERKSHKINFSKNDVDFQGAFCMTDKWQMNDFTYDKITNNIILGPYPENQDQINQLVQQGVKAIFNLQTEEDMEYHGTNLENIKKLSAGQNIKFVHYPVTDMDVHDMALKLRDAVDKFALTVKKYNIVYIHCTSGIYRSPQVIIAYLHLYHNIEINKAISLVEAKRPITKKNRDYLRQVYALKGGYGKVIKQESAETFKEVCKKIKSPVNSEFSPLLNITPKVSQISQRLQNISLNQQEFQQKQIKLQKYVSENKLHSHIIEQQQYFKQQQYLQFQQQQQNFYNRQQQEQLTIKQNYCPLEEMQSIRKRYLKQQQQLNQFSSFHISFQNLSSESLGFSDTVFWNEQTLTKELYKNERRRHSLINSFEQQSTSPQIWA